MQEIKRRKSEKVRNQKSRKSEKKWEIIKVENQKKQKVRKSMK